MASRLRKDLVATTGDDQGVACVEVTDPSSGTSFRFYDFEYALAQQLTGQPLDVVAAWASATYGIELSTETLNAFIEKLAGLGFLTEAAIVSGAQPAILAPYAPSPGSFSYGDLPTDAFGDVPTQVGDAAAPLFGDGMPDLGPGGDDAGDGSVDQAIAQLGSQEHELDVPSHKDRGARPWEGTTKDLPPVDVARRPWEAPKKKSETETTLVPPDPRTLLPRLEVLAGPLPPVVAPGSEHDDDQAKSKLSSGAAGGRTGPGVQSPAGLPVAVAVAVPAAPRRPASGSGSPASTETPLASIARAIAASGDPPPPGAIDIGAATAPGPGDVSGGIKHPAAGTPLDGAAVKAVSVDAPASGRSADVSWASDLAREVQGQDETRGARDDRRQPPRPEVVVMPPMAEPAVAAPTPRRGRLAFLAVVVIGGGLAGAVWFMRPTDGPPAPVSSSEVTPRVHAVSPQPTTFYAWFETIGVVVPAQDQMLAFAVGGRVQEAMAPGTPFSAGESIARLQGAGERDLIVNRLRSRIAYFEQLRDSSRSEGTEAAARQAEAKLTARKQELTTAQAALEELEIRPKIAGVIAQVLAPKGSLIKAGTVVLRVRSTAPRAVFGFSTGDAGRARALGFCRLETIPGTGAGTGVGGGPGVDTGGGAGTDPGTAVVHTDPAATSDDKTRAVDCVLPPSPTPGQPPESRVAVDFMAAPGLVIGTQVRLANARYDGVFPVPRAAVVREGDVDHVWIVSGGGRFAERRTVELAATIDALALVAHGIAVGDAVVVDAPATLRAGTEINVVH